ncbi:unnamed protein product, partial [Mesorhabditis spiculigera]
MDAEELLQLITTARDKAGTDNHEETIAAYTNAIAQLSAAVPGLRGRDKISAKKLCAELEIERGMIADSRNEFLALCDLVRGANEGPRDPGVWSPPPTALAKKNKPRAAAAPANAVLNASTLDKTIIPPKPDAPEDELTKFIEDTIETAPARQSIDDIQGCDEVKKALKMKFVLAPMHPEFFKATEREPSVVFIDEVDSIGTVRGSSQEHEASRRLKCALLRSFDEITQGGFDVYVIGCTNTPWDLDTALLRRFESKYYVALPTIEIIQKMITKALAEVPLDKDLSLEELAGCLYGRSGAEIYTCCRAAVNLAFASISPEDFTDLSASILNKPIGWDEFRTAMRSNPPSATEAILKRYQEWQNPT